MSTEFTKLQKFVFVSTAYANSHLPDGLVKEKLYPLYDSSGEDDIEAELEREAILRTGSSTYTTRFAWPYAFSKFLAERLLLERHSSLPLLIVRPSTHGPSMRTPFQMFGNEESLPISHGITIYLRDPGASRKWLAVADATPGSNIMDEIAVDWVSNLILLHIAAQTRGIVHATAGTYVKLTVDEMLNSRRPDGLDDGSPIEWIQAGQGAQCALANFLVIGNRGWDFSCQKSEALMKVKGPLSLHVRAEEVGTLLDRRFADTLEGIKKELAM